MKQLLGSIFILILINTQLKAGDDTLVWSKYTVLPVAYYLPETNVALELFNFYSFQFQDARRSNVRSFLVYTLNRQKIALLPWQVFTKNENYYFNGFFEYKVFPEYFFGLGNQTHEKQKELYSFSAFTLSNKMFKKIEPDVFAGLVFQHQSLTTKISDNNNLFGHNSGIFGQNGHSFSSVGVGFIIDKRDHVLCPKDGMFLEYNMSAAFGHSGNENVRFQSIFFDFRKYILLKQHNVLSFHFLAQNSLGKIPFRALPQLGEPLLLRGFYQGRFRDHQLNLLQSEYRQNLIKRIGVACFLSAGRVCENTGQMFSERFHYGGGLGLRYRVNKNDQTNIRIDYAITRDSKGLYVYFAEAF